MIVLRPATEFDIEDIVWFRNQGNTYKCFFSEKKFTFWETLKWFRSRDQTVDKIYMALLDQVLVGTCSIYNIQKKRAEVGRIMVNELIRGQGLGKQILQAITKEAKTLGLEQLYANIRPDNKASQKAFLKAGYRGNKDNTFVWLSVERD